MIYLIESKHKNLEIEKEEVWEVWSKHRTEASRNKALKNFVKNWGHIYDFREVEIEKEIKIKGTLVGLSHEDLFNRI